MADPFASHQPSPDSFGTKSQAVTPNNGTDLDPVAKCIVVTSISGGQSLQLLPVGNADGSWVSFEGVPVGFVPPFRVRRVGTSTTCTVVSIEA